MSLNPECLVLVTPFQWGYKIITIISLVVGLQEYYYLWIVKGDKKRDRVKGLRSPSIVFFPMKGQGTEGKRRIKSH